MGDRRRITTFAVGATAGAAVCAALTTGLLGAGADLVGSVPGLLIPAAVADGLSQFGDCEQLRQWYVDQALPQVGPYGFGGGPIHPMLDQRAAAGMVEGASPGAASSAAGDASAAVGSSGTGTNTQEADVDESDIAKTDGRIVVRVSRRQLVVTDVTGPRPVELSRTTLPGPVLQAPELLLRNDRVIVVGDELRNDVHFGGIADDTMPTFVPTGPHETRAHVVSVDLSDPAAPRVTGDERVDGGALSTREYADGTVRLVVTTGFPPLDFVQPNRDRTSSQATRANRRIVRQASIDDWLPGIRRSGGPREPLLSCSEVRHPRTASGFGTISVLTFPFDHADGRSTTAVTAAGDLVYSSADRLYVATATQDFRPTPVDGQMAGSAVPLVPTTSVHAFALDGGRTTYVASGAFRGLVKDRWSFSEYGGHLRVAVALGRDGGGVDNGVLVLGEHGGRLVRTGRVDGLGEGESIQSVRWFGDLAVVVTFRQMDPLYTVDLSDPARPRVVGALKIPGYSSYLHPVGGHLLVGIGHDATSAGMDLGAQAATFDVSHLRDVRRVGRYAFGPQTDASVASDPRTFSYLPETRTLVIPVQDWQRNSSRFVALHVATDGTLTETASWVTRRYAGDSVRTLPLGNGRMALVGDVVRVIDVG